MELQEKKVKLLFYPASPESGSTTDSTITQTPDLMTWLEKQFGKQITSRTWKTVQRILKQLNTEEL